MPGAVLCTSSVICHLIFVTDEVGPVITFILRMRFAEVK